MRVFLAAQLIALIATLHIAGSASAQTDTFCTAAYDADGYRVGLVTQANDQTTLLLNQDGRIARLNITADQVAGNATVFYTGSNCTESAYMLNDQLQPLAGKDAGLDDVWYPDTLASPTQGVYLVSVRNNSGPCTPAFSIRDVVPALNLTLPEFTPPFRLEPEACYTPDPAVAALTPYGLGAMVFVLAFGAYLMVARAPDAGGRESS